MPRAGFSDETQRLRDLAACRKHLHDLKRDRERPPPDVAVKAGFGSRVHTISPAERSSGATSPFALI